MPLWAETRETFLLPADYLIQQSGGGTLGLPRGVGVNVHRGTDIGVAQQLLHVLGCRSVGEKVTCERVPEHIEAFEKRIEGELPYLLRAKTILNEILNEDTTHKYYLLTVEFGIKTYQTYLEWCKEAKKLLAGGQ